MDKPDYELIFKGIAAVLDKAAADAKFRKLCQKKPGEAWLKATGMAMPANLDIRFQDEPKSCLIVGMPPSVPSSSALTDDQLEAVAGGNIFDCGKPQKHPIF